MRAKRAIETGLLFNLAIAAVAWSHQQPGGQTADLAGAGGLLDSTAGAAGAAGTTSCPAAVPTLGGPCGGNWDVCAYGTNTCCGQVYPVIYHCSGNVVVPSLHEPTDCAFIARACVDAGGYDAAAADPQTRDCASPSPAFTSCDSAGQACRDPVPVTARASARRPRRRTEAPPRSGSASDRDRRARSACVTDRRAGPPPSAPTPRRGSPRTRPFPSRRRPRIGSAAIHRT